MSDTTTEKAKNTTKKKKEESAELTNATPNKECCSGYVSHPAAAFAKKFTALKHFINNEFSFSLDKVTQNGGAYASTQQYKEAVSLGCDKVGLTHWFSAEPHVCGVGNISYETSKGIKNYVAGQFGGTLVFCDPDTGYTVPMNIWGAGQDANTDHASLKSSTYAFRSWFLTTFLISNKHERALEFNDEGEVTSVETTPKYGFMSDAERAAKVSSVNTEVKNASEGLLTQMMHALLAVREQDTTFGQKVYDLIVEGDTNGEPKVKDGVVLPYNDAVATLSAIEARADELGVEV